MSAQEGTTGPVVRTPGVEPGSQVWTVVGIWHADRPIPVGAIRGDHGIDGGFHPDLMIEFEGGTWAVAVEADTDTEAEENAVSAMSESEDEDEDG